MKEETICAPATAPVQSPIAIIRISGPESLRAVSAIFSNSSSLQPRRAVFGSIKSQDQIIDDVVAVYFQEPASFTGEEMVEIFCHGNQIIVHKILDMLHEKGIRLAEPGEFTRRAFLKGKIDLTEAEAIHHIITARSSWEVETALKQMHGSLKEAVHTLRDIIIELKADIEAGIDFIEEDIEFVSYDETMDKIDNLRNEIESLLFRCRTGEKATRGVDITIAGRPNVGKSSLLNLMLNQDRAIVSSVPGTTRDMIRETVEIEGLQVNLIDTAGIDTPGDEIERIGIELSHKNIQTASIVIVVLDGTEGITERDREIIKEVKDKKTIFLINKTDIAEPSQVDSMRKEVSESAISVSALKGTGLREVEEAVGSILHNEFVDIQDSFIADIRIIRLLEKGEKITVNCRELVAAKEPPEIIAFELQEVLETMGEITGEITPDDILGSIFERFCIGK